MNLVHFLAISPVLVPLITATLCLLVQRSARAQRAISLVGAVLLMICAVSLLQLAADGQPARTAFGNWPLPFAIEFGVDLTGACLVVITAMMGLASLVFLHSDADPGPKHPLLLPLIHGILMGVGGAFSTADLFNLYVWFEVMLMASVALLALGGRAAQLDGAFKYLTLNLTGTLFLLIAVAMIYGATGHVNFVALHGGQSGIHPTVRLALLTLLTVSFLIKAGAFPFFAWLPASYHTLPGPVLALFAGLLTKVGVYSILRTLGGVFAPAPEVLMDCLGWVAALTMISGVLGAAYHWDIRRILAFHIVSQIGYILLGIALASKAGNSATLFYTIHHIVVKSNLFLIGAMVARLTGSYDLRQSGGLYKACPLLSVIFLIPALSLVGIPPLSGFWAKLLILSESVGQNRIAWTVAALVVSMLTLYSMMKVWLEAFWKSHPDPDWVPPRADLRAAYGVTMALAAFTVWVGLNPGYLASLTRRAAEALEMQP